MYNDLEQEKFMEFFTTVTVNSKFIERDPDDFGKCWHPDLIQCMELAKKQGRITELIDALEHKLAGINLSEEGEYAEAIVQLKKAADIFPEGLHFKFVLALGYMRVEKYNEAMEILEECLLAKPNDWEAKYYLSRCCYMINNVDRAIVLLEDCIKTNYEPEMSLHMGIYCASKGESIGKELYRKLGRYDQNKTAEMASPYLEKAIKSFQEYLKSGGEVDMQYFNKICNMFDQLSPGGLQYMGIPLSLNRLHRVLSSVDDLPEPMLDAEFSPVKKVCSAHVVSCVQGKSAGRYQASVLLFETDDSDKVANKLVDSIALLTIVYPGLHDPNIPDVHIM